MIDNCDEVSFGRRANGEACPAKMPWALPLLGSLVRREILNGASGEKAEWMYDMLRDIERGSKCPRNVAVPQIEIR
jgi:hypothetical protein